MAQPYHHHHRLCPSLFISPLFLFFLIERQSPERWSATDIYFFLNRLINATFLIDMPCVFLSLGLVSASVLRRVDNKSKSCTSCQQKHRPTKANPIRRRRDNWRNYQQGWAPTSWIQGGQSNSRLFASSHKFMAMTYPSLVIRNDENGWDIS